MANSVTIPQDIIYNVIAAVAADDRRLLQTCALVSSSFLRPSRKHIFSKVVLRNNRIETCQNLLQFLVQNPSIQSFVRRLSILVLDGTTDCNKSLLAILRLPFKCLEAFSLQSGGFSNWSSFSDELKDTLSNIIHSSALNIIRLCNIITVPISLFLGIAHLTKLELYGHCPKYFTGRPSNNLLALAVSKEATTGCHVIVDQCARGWWSEEFDPDEPIFLSSMCGVRRLEITIVPDFSIDILSLLIGSLSVSLATLEHIKLDFCFFVPGDDDEDNAAFYDRYNADVWKRLKALVTNPTCSKLQRVDIHIRPNQWRFNEDQIREAVHASLPSLYKKGILFVKAHVATR